MFTRVLASSAAAAIVALMASLPVVAQSASTPAPSIGYYGVQRRIAYTRTRHRGLPGAIPTSRVSGRATTRAASRCRDPRILATSSIRAMSSGPRGRSRRSKGFRTHSMRSGPSAVTTRGARSGRHRSSSIRQTVARPRSRQPPRNAARPATAAPSVTVHSISPEDFTMYDRCITRGIVGSVLRVVYGNGNRITQAPGMVAISYEMVHDTRVLYTDGRPHVSPSIKQLLGDVPRAVGRRRTGRRDDEPDGQDEHWTERQRSSSQRPDEDH